MLEPSCSELSSPSEESGLEFSAEDTKDETLEELFVDGVLWVDSIRLLEPPAKSPPAEVSELVGLWLEVACEVSVEEV